MKQQIEVEQLNELNDAQKKVLRDWWKPSTGDWIYTSAWADSETKNDLVICISSPAGMMWSALLKEAMPLLSIGQMIEFLKDSVHWTHNKSMVSLNLREDSITNICDTLWEAVKEELEK